MVQRFRLRFLPFLGEYAASGIEGERDFVYLRRQPEIGEGSPGDW